MKPPVVILCGGRGTRLRERTESVPKALVEIGGRPILWHVIQIYAAQGFERFLLAHRLPGRDDRGVRRARALAGRASRSSASTPALDTPTGGRIARLARAARRRHASAPPTPTASPTSTSARCSTSTAATAALATMTVVRPHLQWGVAELDGDGRVDGLRREAAQRALDQRRLLLLRARRARLPRRRTACSSASRSSGSPPTAQLRAFRHEGFWDCMDTYKDAVVLNDLWAAGEAPWQVWDAAGRRRGEARAGHRRPRLRRLAPGPGAARARRRGRPCSTAAPRRRALSGLDAAGDRGRGRAGRGRPARRRAVGATLAAGEFDVVFHLAAQTIVGAGDDSTRPRPSRSTCAAPGTLLEACRRADVPAVVVASSDKAYGAQRRAALPRGLRRCAPASPYEASKAAADVDRPQLLAQPTACRSRSPASPTSTAAATSTSPA